MGSRGHAMPAKTKAMLAVVVFGTFVAILDQTLMSPAQPTIMREMGIDANTVQWLTTGFTLADALVIPVAAYLMERFRTKSLYLFSMLLFTAGSLVTAWSPSFPVLLCGRIVQAAAAGMLLPIVQTVLMLTFPPERRGSAMGAFGIVVAFAPAIGPSLAGFIIDALSWRDMFYIIAALGALVSLATPFAVGDVIPQKDGARLDKPSVILSSLGFGLLLYGCSAIGSAGLNPMDALLAVAGLAIAALFFRRQLRIDVPMLDVRVFFTRDFMIGTVVGMFVQAALFAASVLLPIYVQTLRGYSALDSGLIMLPGAIVMGIMNPVAGRLMDEFGPRGLALTGTAVLTAASAALGFFTDSTPLGFIAVIYTVRMFAITLVNMPIATWAMNSLPNEVMNHGTSANNMMRQVAGSFGTAILVSVCTAVRASNVSAMGENAAYISGVNAAFLTGAALCAIAFALVFLFVKKRPAVKPAPHGEVEL